MRSREPRARKRSDRESSPELIAREGGNAFTQPLYFGEYYDVPPITMVIGRVKRVFGMTLTPFAEGLKETYKWYLRHNERKPNFKLDDLLIRQVREPARLSG